VRWHGRRCCRVASPPSFVRRSTCCLPIDSPCACEHKNPDSLDARLFPSVVLAVAPAVIMDEASSLGLTQGRACYDHGRSIFYVAAKRNRTRVLTFVMGLYVSPKKPTRVAAPSPRASLGRRTVCGRTEQCRPPVSKRYDTKVRMVWGSFLIAAAALKTPTRNGSNAQGVNLTLREGVWG